MDKPIIGILALQGAVQPHKLHIEAAGAKFRAVKTPADFDAVDGFILPGGESTTMLKLIDRFNLWDSLAENFKIKPVWGICAGAILLADKVLVSSPHCHLDRKSNEERLEWRDPSITASTSSASTRDDNTKETQKSFGLLPITVERNGYGRQIDSHYADVNGYPVSFIRAPVIISPSPSEPLSADAQSSSIPLPEGRGKRGKTEQGEGDTLQILATHQNKPVWVRKASIMATTFHPELTQDCPSPMHQMFVEIVKQSFHPKLSA